MTDFDVIVVGSGAAGLSAALEAADAGASVLVVDSEDVVGGSSRLSGGIVMGAGTAVQVAAGIEDSAEGLFRDYMTLNQWNLEVGVARRLADECGPAVDWLTGHGVEYLPELYFAGDERVPRCHVPATGGTGAIDAMHAACRRRPGIEWALKRRVDRLIVEAGRVVGVAVGDDEVRAAATVLATGGFGANPELVREALPRTAGGGDWNWYIGAPSARGDVFGLAGQVHAQLTGHDRVLLLLEPAFDRRLEVYFPGWLIMVNGLGRRFLDESAPYSVTQPVVEAQPGPIWAVFDDAAKRAAQVEGSGASKKQDIPTDVIDKNWVEPVLDEMLDKGRVLRADSLAELAALIGVPAENLEGTVEGYNVGVEAGRDELYLKDARMMVPVATPPFYATELRLSVICLTSHGPRIDADARVLDQRTRPVPGLFAAGECTGGVLGDVYVGSGNSWANCVVFGRVAGRGAAALADAARVEQPAGATP